jgi:hypothetical protein
VRDVFNRVLLDGGPNRIFSAGCPSAITDDIQLVKNFFAAVCLPTMQEYTFAAAV